MRGDQHEKEKGIINYSSIAFLIHFKGLYLMGKEKNQILCLVSLLLFLQIEY